MTQKPGEVMGYLAYGHPFLDGNGRTIMFIHAELARRAGFGIDWSVTDKDQYLAALTQELEEPGKGKLDAYLRPFMRKGSEMETIADAIKAAPGLDGSNADAVAGDTRDPTLKARYEARKSSSARRREAHKRAKASRGEGLCNCSIGRTLAALFLCPRSYFLPVADVL